MTSSTSLSGAGTPTTEPSTTSEYSEMQTGIRPALEARKDLDIIQEPKVPRRLKLILPKMAQEPTAEPSPLRRSRRSQNGPQKRDNGPVGASEATLPRKSLHSIKEPNQKASYSLDTTGTLMTATHAPNSAVQEEIHRKAHGPARISENSTSFAKSSPGNASNPIDVDEIPSPLPPHMFVYRNAGYHTPLPLSARASVPPTLLTPNGARILAGKVSGYQSHEMYKGYIDRRDAPAPPGFTDSCTKLSVEVLEGRAPSLRFLPPGTGSPASASQYGHTSGLLPIRQYATPLQTQNQVRSQHYMTNPHSSRRRVTSYPVHPLLNEKYLRQRAVQFVLDHTRPRPRKRRLADDPDETSSSEYEDDEQDPKKKKVTTPSLSNRLTTPSQPMDETFVDTPDTGISEDDIYDRNLKLAEMVEHTQLLTTLLMTYPRSEDQKGLRDDIAMLATVTNKRLSSWVSAEENFELGTRERLRLAQTLSPHVTESSSGLGDEEMARIANIATEAAEAQKKQQDDETRKYLYASSGAESEDDGAK